MRPTISGPALAAVDEIACRRGLTRRQVVERAIGVLQQCEQAAADGFDICAVDGAEIVRVVGGRMRK
ncbi:MAG: hypothetical protein KGL39_42325 [Patescibacteria group bacterium]|nr:hypothetical protein [Patescibacteria group bacterium]